jgi:aromatic-L-amino-acid decarboxylase
MDWSAQLFGLSDAFFNTSGVGGGVLQTTASEAGLTAVVAARSHFRKLNPNIKLESLVVYVTLQTHSMGKKAAQILGLSCRALNVKSEDNYGLRAVTLIEALEEDKAAGKHPFILSKSIIH